MSRNRKWLWLSYLATFAVLSPLAVPAQEPGKPAEKKEEKKEKKGLTLKPERKIEFTTDEATWLSLDGSPDGKKIVFELLGDLYTLPMEGGEAKRLTSGMAFDSQPRFSPDGKWLAFLSEIGRAHV